MPSVAELKPVANVLAVVVTYNPGDDLAKNLEALSAEVRVIVVDNGSQNAAAVEAATLATGCRLISNGENRGVAAALNQAAHIAAAEGFEWLATFDHDSLIPQGAFTSILACYARHPSRDKIAIISMTRRDRGTGYDYTPPWAILEETSSWRSVRTTITSGSLIKPQIFSTVGLFDESLFIDAVDHDFALRCRQMKYLVIEDKTTILLHNLGQSETMSLFGRVRILTNHSPTRQYYIARNNLEVIFRSLSIDPTWSWRAFVYVTAGLVEACLFERDRLQKLSAILQGGKDFILRRFGPRPRPARRTSSPPAISPIAEPP